MAAPSDRAVPQRPIKRIALLVGALVALDIATKALVEDRLVRGEERWLVDGVVGLERTSNSGVAFGLFEGRAAVWPLMVVAFAGLAWIWRQTLTPGSSSVEAVPLALIAAGAFGNLIDRLGDGRVTDFVAIGPWPRFNVADSALTVGIVAVLVIPWLLEVSDSHDRP